MIESPSEYQLAIFDTLLNTDKNIVIQATAGSGKTSTIITGSKLLSPSVSQCFLAFNKSIVEHLKTKLPQNVYCKTAHSIGFSALTSHYRINFKLSEFKNLRFINEVLKDKKDLNEKQKKYLQFIMLEIVNFIRLNCDESTLENITSICDHHSIMLEEEHQKDCLAVLEKMNHYNKLFSKTHNLVDFTDMITLCLNPKIRFPQFDIVFIDECQDLSKAQQLLTLKLLKPQGRLIAIGDKNQAIYQFCGGDGQSFQFFQNRNNTSVLPLSISYRCGKKIAENAKTVYSEIEPFEENKEGEVREGTADEITTKDIVICRTTLPLISVYLNLITRKQGATIIGKDIENGLLKTLSFAGTGSKDTWFDNLKTAKLNLKKELIAKGISNPSFNKKYISFAEQIIVIKILAHDASSINEIEEKIREMFKEKDNVTKLMTIHRCKGLENDRIFLITHFEGKQLIPSPYARRDWELIAERNCLFVAYTRAISSLIYLKL